MASSTSKLKAISPAWWGYRKVKIFFGTVRVAESQRWVFSGEIMQNVGDGSVWEFKYREGDTLYCIPVTY
jgi:hypothetical protein